MVDSAFALMARPHLIELSRGSFDSYIVSAKHQARPSLRNTPHSGGGGLDGSVLSWGEIDLLKAKRYENLSPPYGDLQRSPSVRLTRSGLTVSLRVSPIR